MQRDMNRGSVPLGASWEALKADKLGLFFLVGTFVLLLGLWLWIRISFSELPELLPLHFDVAGRPDRIGERRELYTLPAIGLVIAVVNVGLGLVLRFQFRQRFSSYLLWAGGLLVQVLFWVATWNIIR